MPDRRSLRCRLARPAAVALLAACLLAPAVAAGQPASRAEEEAMRLVVMIRADLAGTEQVGAGIIVGAANDRLYVVTANHVVRAGDLAATNVRVQLRGLPGEAVAARLLTDHDARQDVAVLSVSGLAALGPAAADLPFDRLGDPAALRRGDRVRALGNPQGSAWGVNVTPDAVAAASDSVVTFESRFVSVGHSGGALLDEQWQLVGLLQTVEPPVATARRLDVVLDRLRGWGYPVQLRRRFGDAALELVSAGGGFTCAVGPRGAATCWGRNEDGELGTGTAAPGSTPVPVHGGHAFATVSAGLWYACGVTLDGAAYCWGNDDSGEPGAARTVRSRVPVPVGGELRFTGVSAGLDHACAVATTGTVYCWGANDHGQLGDGTRQARPAPAAVRGGLTFRAVSAGARMSCGITGAGKAYCWGSNASGGLGDGSREARAEPVPVEGDLTFASVSAGNGYACGVTTDGAAHCWGDNTWGQLGDGTERDASRPTPVAGGIRFRTLAVTRTGGRATTCGVATDGTAHCWGWESEALGRRDGDPRRPAPVEAAVRFRSVSVDGHACGLAEDGEVYCWGSNRYGQLGDGPAGGARFTPRVVPRRP